MRASTTIIKKVDTPDLVVITLQNEGFHNCKEMGIEYKPVVITLQNEGFHNFATLTVPPTQVVITLQNEGFHNSG